MIDNGGDSALVKRRIDRHGLGDEIGPESGRSTRCRYLACTGHAKAAIMTSSASTGSQANCRPPWDPRAANGRSNSQAHHMSLPSPNIVAINQPEVRREAN